MRRVLLSDRLSTVGSLSITKLFFCFGNKETKNKGVVSRLIDKKNKPLNNLKFILPLVLLLIFGATTFGQASFKVISVRETTGAKAKNAPKTNPDGTRSNQGLVYEIKVLNDGTVPLTGVRVTVEMTNGVPVTDVSYSSGNTSGVDPDNPSPTITPTTPVVETLDPGETWTYTAKYTVRKEDLDAGTDLQSKVTVTVNELPRAPKTGLSQKTQVEQTSTFKVTKVQTSPVNATTDRPLNVDTAGQVIKYEITVENTGNTTLTIKEIKDKLPDGTILDLSTTTPDSGDLGNAGKLEAGEKWVYKTQYNGVSQADIDTGKRLKSKVKVEVNETTTTLPEDKEAEVTTYTASCDIQIFPMSNWRTHAKLKIDNDMDGDINPGDEVEFKIPLYNPRSRNVAKGIKLTDKLPDGYKFLDYNPKSNGITYDEHTGIWTGIPDINAGIYQVKVFHLYAKVKPFDNTKTANEQYENWAEVKSETYDINERNNKRNITPKIVNFSVKQSRIGRNKRVYAGEVIRYRVTVKNTGNTQLTLANADSGIDGGLKKTLTTPTETGGTRNGKLDVDETWTYTTDYTVTLADVDAGTDLKNKAWIKMLYSGRIKERISNTVTTKISDVDLKLEISSALAPGGDVNSDGKISPGDNVEFKIKLTNLNRYYYPAKGIELTDILPDGYEYLDYSRGNGTYDWRTGIWTGINDIAGGGTATLTITAKVKPFDTSSGKTVQEQYENKASVKTTKTKDSRDANNHGSNTPEIYSFDVKKERDGANNPVSNGDNVKYKITITNTGNKPLTGVLATDTPQNRASSSFILNKVTDNLTESKPPANRILDVGEKWTYTTRNILVKPVDVKDSSNPFKNKVSVKVAELPNAKTSEATTPINRSYDFTVTKVQTSPTPPDGVNLNDVIEYKITIKNEGNTPLTGVVATDKPPRGAPYDLDKATNHLTESKSPADDILDIDETWTYTTTYKVVQADIDAAGNELFNKVSVKTNEITTPRQALNPPSTRVNKDSNFTVVKEQTSSNNPVGDGETIDYKITITNTGNTALTGVVATDTKPDGTILILDKDTPGLTGDTDGDGDLDKGEIWVYTTNYTVNSNDVKDSSVPIINKVSVKVNELTNPKPAEDTKTKVKPLPDFEILEVKQISPINAITGNKLPVERKGDIITYQITVENTGNTKLTGVVATDTYPGETSGTPLPKLGDPPIREDKTTNGDLDVGETWTYTTTYTVKQSDIDNGIDLENKISVITDQTGILAPKTDNETTTVNKISDLKVTKVRTSGKNPVDLDDEIKYSITIENRGNTTLTDVVAMDTPPGGGAPYALKKVENQLTGDTNTNDKLDVGETWIYTTTYKVKQADIDAGVPLENKVSVTTAEKPTPDPVKGNSSVSTGVNRTYGISVDKVQVNSPTGGTKKNPVDSPTDIIYYETRVTNNGTATLTNVVVNDTPPGGTAAPLPPPNSGDLDTDGDLDVGETWIYKTQYRVTQADIDARGTRDTGTLETSSSLVSVTEIPNTATIPQREREGNVSTRVYTNPNFTVVKGRTSTKNTVNSPTDVITYKITVTNTGNATLHNLVATDTTPGGTPAPLPAPDSGDINTDGNLDVGETWIYNTNYRVQQSDINSRTIFVLTNKVSVKVDELASKDDRDPGTAVEKIRDFSVKQTITSTKDPVDSPTTDVVNYQIEIKNEGNTTLTISYVKDEISNNLGSTPITLPTPTKSINSDNKLDVGEKWTYTMSYNVKQSDIDAGGSLANKVSAKAVEITSERTDTKSVSIKQDPKLEVTIDQIPPIKNPVDSQGDVIKYKITLKNEGNTTLKNIVANYQVSNTSRIGTTIPLTTTVVKSINSDDKLDVGETWTYEPTYTVKQLDINDGIDLVNTVSVTTDKTPTPNVKTLTTKVENDSSIEVTMKRTDATANPSMENPGVIKYHIEIKNASNKPFTNVKATYIRHDGKNIKLPRPNRVLNSRQPPWTYDVEYTVTQSDIDKGDDIINKVYVEADELSGKKEGSVITVINQKPLFKVVKEQTSPVDSTTGNKLPVKKEGDVITYKITVENKGNVTLTNVEATDTPPGGGTTVLNTPTESNSRNGKLDVGEKWVYTTKYTVKQADIDVGDDLVNKVSVTTDETDGPHGIPMPDPTDAESQVTTKIVKTDLEISKTHQANYLDKDNSNSITKGDDITFVITVKNNSTDNATGIIVTDELPKGYTYVSSEPITAYNATGIVWNVGELAGGDTKTFKVTAVVKATDGKGSVGEYKNVATVTSKTKDPDDTNNNAEDEPDVIQVSDLSVSEIVDKPKANVGETVTFTIDIKNSGSSDANNVGLISRLPSGFTFLSSSVTKGTAVYDELTSTLTVATIKPGENTILEIKAKVNPPKGDYNEYKAKTEIVGNDTFDIDSTPGNHLSNEDDQSSAQVNLPKLNLSIDKTVDNINPRINKDVTFTITVANKSLVKATNISVSEVITSGYQYVSDKASNGSYDKISNWTIPSLAGGEKATLEIKAIVLDSGDYNNFAQILYRDQQDTDSSDNKASLETKPICIKIYNEFTPNGDGINDFFTIDCIEKYPNSELKIYNRWGNLVYSKKGYKNTWNGIYERSSKDSKLPSGTYYYHLDLKDGSKIKIGWIYLNR